MPYRSNIYEYILLTALLVLPMLTAIGQDMSQGFGQLEAGEFVKARIFFTEILKRYPENKTALLCYGRATGLSGDPKEALRIFLGLQTADYNNTEILLNIAEAHLWNKAPENAIPVYRELIAGDSSLFAAWLGLANSHSMNKDYKEAYRTIKQALTLDPENKQAHLSKKYIILGYANSLAGIQQKTEQSLELLEENLIKNPNDQETLLLKGNILLQNSQYKAARDVFGDMEDRQTAYYNLSLACHMDGRNRQALQFADSLRILSGSDEMEKFRADIHYVNALLWNNRLISAKKEVNKLGLAYGHLTKTYLTSAQVALYFADFEDALDHYGRALRIDSTSFAARLGSADTYHALKQDRKAYEIALAAKSHWPERQETENFIGKLNREHRPEATVRYVYSFSSDGSYNRDRTLSGKLSLTPAFGIKMTYGDKKYFQQGSDDMLSRRHWRSDLTYQHDRNLRVFGNITYSLLENERGRAIGNANLLLAAGASLRVNRLYAFNTGYRSELPDFNQALVSQNLTAHHIYHQGNLFIPETGTGNYTELVRTYMSDANQRSLLFTSLYQQIGAKKHWKAGVNYLVLTFRENKPRDYFSPLSHQQVEGFVHANYLLPVKLKITGEIAWGVQWNSQPAQETIRIKATLSKDWHRFSAACYGQYSTAANTSFNGFSFTEIGARVSLAIMSKPVFFRRFEKQFSKQSL